MRVTRITVAIVGDNVDKKSEPGAVSDRSGIQDESDLSLSRRIGKTRLLKSRVWAPVATASVLIYEVPTFLREHVPNNPLLAVLSLLN